MSKRTTPPQIATIPKTSTIDAVAIAAESSSPPMLATEHAVSLCRQPGCENLEARSDGKCNKHSRLRPISTAMVHEINERLKSFAPEAADLTIEAARIGAAEGDHKAAAWILTHSGVVKPVGPSPAAAGDGNRLVVQVGIILPGLPGADV